MGVIKMISEGSTNGDSNRARKSRSRRECMEVKGVRGNEAIISFGPEDLKSVNLPHNDALGYQLEIVETALFGFAGHVVYPEGEIVLPLTLGTRELKKTVMTTFTVVDAPSSYNIIMGRPTMNELRAVASTYHQNIKFLVGSRVGEVRGYQPSSRKCYLEAVRVDQRKVKREEKVVITDEGGRRMVEEGEVQFVAEKEQEVVEIGPGKEIWVALRPRHIHLELTGISPLIAEHHLNILPGSQPVKQKKRHFGPEKDKVIDVHVKDLLKAGHIREIQFPTRLSNVVLLVDSTSGCKLLSFMDAYQGYHQISLAKEDQDKASFITSGGTFCYVVMPFGLKNARATYQRLMKRVFEKQLGRNVEVYVDDILGKSKEVADFISDLEETFATLVHYGIKLNPG
ncbi:uncharacterized protein LOC142537770 [Primulina tabacum]|uniref:uncharacterized protein LOC142537770 n=1 Tax=Primulina tabacum TaxID=48773 RepID=UPI003F5A89D0